jgi:DNA-binding MarR family transcriptional regulator
MAAAIPLSNDVVREVRERCLCFAAQRAARKLARVFDRAFADLDLTNGQFSMMVALSGLRRPKLGQLAGFLAIDSATATAAVKKLARRGLVTLQTDDTDRRARRVTLTKEGYSLIAKAIPLWRKEHAKLDGRMQRGKARAIRDELASLAASLA